MCSDTAELLPPVASSISSRYLLWVWSPFKGVVLGKPRATAKSSPAKAAPTLSTARLQGLHDKSEELIGNTQNTCKEDVSFEL